MLAVTVTRYGPPESLEIRTYPDPVPGPHQIRVRVKAAGVNFADCLARMGLYPGRPDLPFIPGLECAGIVDSVGTEADRSWLGRHVVAPVWFGGYAEAVLTQPEDVVVMPPGKSFEEGAAVSVTYLTAYHGLYYLGNLQQGDWVLIHTAAGGVGTAAVQLAKLRGATVIGVASAAKQQFLRSIGVDHPIDYASQHFEDETLRLTGRRGVRIVMDPVGGKSFAKSYRCLRRGGILLLYGLSSAAPGTTRNWLKAAFEYITSPSFPAVKLMNDNKGVVGYHIGRMIPEKELLRREAQEIARLWAED